MARRIKVDPDKLVKMVQEGTVEKEVLEKFGLDSINQFKVARVKALNRTEQTAKSRSTAAASARLSGRVKVSKRGSIAISRKLVEALGFQIGDTFQVSPSKAGLSLKKRKREA